MQYTPCFYTFRLILVGSREEGCGGIRRWARIPFCTGPESNGCAQNTGFIAFAMILLVFFIVIMYLLEICYVYIWFWIILIHFKSILIAPDPFKLYSNWGLGNLINLNPIRDLILFLWIWECAILGNWQVDNLRIWQADKIYRQFEIWQGAKLMIWEVENLNFAIWIWSLKFEVWSLKFEGWNLKVGHILKHKLKPDIWNLKFDIWIWIGFEVGFQLNWNCIELNWNWDWI